MIKRIFALITAACVTFGQSAAFAQISATQTSEESDISLEITLPDRYIEDYYSLYVLNPGKTNKDLSAYDSGAVQFYTQGEYKEGGEKINFKINRSLFDESLTPHFKVLLRAGDYSEETEFSAYDANVRSALLSEINSKSTDRISDLADRTADVFNARLDTYDNISDKKALAYKLFELYKNQTATTDNIAYTMEMATLISGAQSGEIAMVNSEKIIYNDILGIDAPFSEALSEIKDKEAINNALKGRSYASADELKKALTEEIILAAVYNNKSLGYGHIEKIISKYSAYFETKGLNLSAYNSSLKDSVAQKIVLDGKLSLSELVSKINELSGKKNETDGSQSGGGTSYNPSNKNGGITAGGKVQQQSGTAGFSDMAQAEWAKAKVLSLKEKGIVSGDGDNFYPNNFITRAELTKMIVDALGINAESNTLSFDDVLSGAWYESYIKRGVGASIIYGDGTNFYPNDNIKRQDIAAICYRALQYKGISLNNTAYQADFTDTSDISEYARESVERLYQYGIINGNDLNQFLPLNNATRAEAAVIIWGILNGVNSGFNVKRMQEKPAVDKTVVNAKFEGRVLLMVKAGIVSAENAGNIEKKVTRAEFAKILAKYANKEDITSSERFYDDVTGEMENDRYINGMTSLGYLSAREGRVYEPNEYVTQKEVKIAVLNVLGYGSAMNSEADYLKTASNIDLKSNVRCLDSEPITMGGILSLFESSLEKEVMSIEMAGPDGVRLTKGTSFLENFYDIHIAKGIMNGNNVTNYNANVSPQNNTVLINSKGYEIDDDLYYMNDYLGYYLEVAYYEEDNKIVGFIPLKNSELVISDSDISEYSDGRVFYVLDDERREKSVKIPDDAVIVYNGIVEKSYTEDMFSIESGSIEFIGGNSDSYNVVKIYDYDTIVSNGASAANNKVYSKNTDRIYNLENYNNVIIRTGNGSVKSIADIKAGSVLSVAESKNKTNIIITVADGIIKGKITAFDAGDMTCMIGGKVYDLLKSSNVDGSMLRSSGNFYLDYKGRIAWAETGGSSDMKYGYLVKAGYDDSTDGMFFKIFNDEGNMEMLQQTEEVEIDGDKVSGANISDYFLYNSEEVRTDKMQPQLIKYRKNADGVIKVIDTAHRGEHESSSSLSLNRDADSSRRQFAARTGRLVDLTSNESATLYNAMRLDENTVIFKVPDFEETNPSDDDFTLVPYSSMQEGKILAGPVLAYDTDFENADLVGALTYSNLMTESGIKSYAAFFVKSVENSLTEDENIVLSLTGYDYHSKQEKTLTSYDKENLFEGVKSGDVIRYALDEENRVNEIIIDFDRTTAAAGLKIVPWSIDNTGLGSGNIYASYEYGVFTHKNGNYVNFAGRIQIENGKIKRGGSTYDISNTYVILFDTKTGRSKEISPEDISEYIYNVNPDARVYINTSYTELVNVIIYI